MTIDSHVPFIKRSARSLLYLLAAVVINTIVFSRDTLTPDVLRANLGVLAQDLPIFNNLPQRWLPILFLLAIEEAFVSRHFEAAAPYYAIRIGRLSAWFIRLTLTMIGRTVVISVVFVSLAVGFRFRAAPFGDTAQSILVLGGWMLFQYLLTTTLLTNILGILTSRVGVFLLTILIQVAELLFFFAGADHINPGQASVLQALLGLPSLILSWRLSADPSLGRSFLIYITTAIVKKRSHSQINT